MHNWSVRKAINVITVAQSLSCVQWRVHDVRGNAPQEHLFPSISAADHRLLRCSRCWFASNLSCNIRKHISSKHCVYKIDCSWKSIFLELNILWLKSLGNLSLVWYVNLAIGIIHQRHYFLSWLERISDTDFKQMRSRQCSVLRLRHTECLIRLGGKGQGW